jgi:hypothetical protein
MQPIVKPGQKIDRPLRVLIVEDAKSDITYCSSLCAREALKSLIKR